MTWIDKPPTEDGVYFVRGENQFSTYVIYRKEHFQEITNPQWLGPLALIDPDELAELRRKAAAFDGMCKASNAMNEMSQKLYRF